MKLLKILSLAAVAAMALMAFAASSASATALYNGATKLGIGANVDFSLKSGTSLTLADTEAEPFITCTTSTVKFSIANAGGASATVSGNTNELTFGNCSFATTTVANGGFEIHQIGTGTNGTVTSNAEIAVTSSTPFFGSCVYGVVAHTDLGTITTASSGAATFHMNVVTTRRTGSSITCPETATWTGSYVTTEPSNPRIEAS